MMRIIAGALLLSLWGTVVMAASFRNIGTYEAKELIDKSRNVFILDVRTEEERRQGYIPGSILVPIDMLEKRMAEVPRNRPVVVYCTVGYRSKMAAQALVRQGYGDVYNLRDGIVGWGRKGLPLQR